MMKLYAVRKDGKWLDTLGNVFVFNWDPFCCIIEWKEAAVLHASQHEGATVVTFELREVEESCEPR